MANKKFVRRDGFRTHNFGFIKFSDRKTEKDVLKRVRERGQIRKNGKQG